MLCNASHKQAVKAALGLIVASRGHSAAYAALAVFEGAVSLELNPGDMGPLPEMHRYACGVSRKEEAVSNRQWGRYPADVQRLATLIADLGESALAESWPVQ